jgi:protein-tyrosine sulfotransferase
MDAPIFILSDFRSGSTLLRYALDAHPEICCSAELGMAHFCQEVFRIVELTTDDGPLSAATKVDHRMATVRQIADQVMSAYCLRKGKERWCEKSPANTNLLGVLGAVFPDAQYICLYRHGLDQIHSFLELDVPNRLEAYMARNRGNVLAAAIDRWCEHTEKLLAFEHLHLSRSRGVYYERFVKSPEEELAHLMLFLGVRVVPGLSLTAFQAEHDRGPGDAKIRGSTAVDSGRTGKGQALKLTLVPTLLRERLARLLEILGYPQPESGK